MTIQQILNAGRKHNASDIHVVVGMPPMFRIDGEIVVTKGDSVNG